MKRTLLLILAVLIAVGVGVGATFAFFTDATESQANEFVAGTVALDGYRTDEAVIQGPMFYISAQDGDHEVAGWAPGDAETRGFQIQNTGSLDARLKSLSVTIEGDQALAEVLEVKVCEIPDCSDMVYYTGTLAQLAATPHTFTPPSNFELAAGGLFWEGDIITLHFKVTLPLSAGNTLQEKSIRAAFAVLAEQVRNNP